MSCMTIHVRSPHDGQPVKVREEDVGRAVRDAQGRVLYVVPSSDEQGHYGSITRSGSERDEQRAKQWELNPPDPITTTSGATSTQDASSRHVHDATGRPRAASWRGRLVILALGVLVLFLVWLFGFGPLANRWTPSPAPPLEQKLNEQSTEQERDARSHQLHQLHQPYQSTPSFSLASPLTLCHFSFENIPCAG